VVTTSRKKRLGKSQSCFRIVRRKSRKPSRTTTNRSGSSIEEANVRKETTISEDPTVAASSFLTTISEDPTVAASSFLTTISEDPTVADSSTPSSQKTEMTREDMAAVKIQAFFRGHLVFFLIYYISFQARFHSFSMDNANVTGVFLGLDHF
jgi:hypothetical protein